MIKICFHDGYLFYDVMKSQGLDVVYPIDANMGYSENICKFKNIINEHKAQKRMQDLVLVTNQIALLNTEFSFDSNGKCQVYFWSKEQRKWINAQDLTQKELRKGHNIEMMYRNGVFDI